MSISDNISNFVHALESAAPHLAPIVQEAENVAEVVGTAFPAAHEAASAFLGAAHVAEAVGHAVADSLTGTALPTAIAGGPANPVTNPPAIAGDAAAAAGGVAASSADHQSLVQRVMLLESILHQTLPMILAIGKELGY